MLRQAVLIVLAGLVLLACSSSSPSTDAQADGSVKDMSVQDSATPPADGEGADTNPPAPSCTAKTDCPTGSLCNCVGTCVTTPTTNPCLTAKNCPNGEWCDICTGYCAVEVDLCGACEADGACGEDGACLPFASGGSFCGKSCLTEAGCPVGYSCIAVDGAVEKMCVPKSGACADLGLCEDDGECPDGEVCSDLLKECAPGCADDDSCPVGLICAAARCVAPCASDSDCEQAEAVCTETGHCKVPGACANKLDCPLPETYCNKSTGMCADGCLIDSDCGDAGKMCQAKVCVPKGCLHNYQCAFGEVCAKDSGACIPSPEDHCAPCTAGEAGACGGEPNLCLTLQEEDPATGQMVEKGDFCILPCADDAVDQCPQGYNCHPIEGDGFTGMYCVRSCWYDPVGAP